MTYTVQPITDFSIFTTPTHDRKGVQFTATWSRTAKELARELDYLEASGTILEIAVGAAEIRLDGTLRANARPSHPGVRLSFQSKHGALSYTCDTYESRWSHQMPDWQANVRAIVLTLESLRAVDRYGATKGEQYAGFKALGAGSGATPMGGMTRQEAIYVLDENWGGGDWGFKEDGERVYRLALAATHPDRNGGDQTAWDQVELAGRVLGLRS